MYRLESMSTKRISFATGFSNTSSVGQSDVISTETCRLRQHESSCITMQQTDFDEVFRWLDPRGSTDRAINTAFIVDPHPFCVCPNPSHGRCTSFFYRHAVSIFTDYASLIKPHQTAVVVPCNLLPRLRLGECYVNLVMPCTRCTNHKDVRTDQQHHVRVFVRRRKNPVD